MAIQTIQGQPASILGLAGQQLMEPGCVDLAWRTGGNYFFSYGMGDSPFIKELKPLFGQHRESVIMATGSEKRELASWTDYLEQVRQTLGIETIDILFAEYVSPSDDWDDVRALLNQLYEWKAQGFIRYVGVTTHNRDIGLQMVQNRLCDVLMHRYNIAHRRAEETLFPSATAADIPVVAFTSTRWSRGIQTGTLHPQQLLTAIVLDSVSPLSS